MDSIPPNCAQRNFLSLLTFMLIYFEVSLIEKILLSAEMEGNGRMFGMSLRGHREKYGGKYQWFQNEISVNFDVVSQM